MTDRIQQLAEQSGALWDDKYHWYVGNKQMKQFAQLIVQECAAYMYENYPDTRYKVNYMRKHMGDPSWNVPIEQ